MGVPTVTTFSFPTTIDFGIGAVDRIGQRMTELGALRPLLVTDAGLAKTEAFARVRQALDAARVQFVVFTGVEPNPTDENVEAGATAFKYDGCDIIIAVGGGSAIDVGKAIRLRSTHGKPLLHYDDADDGASRIRSEMPPMIAVPTTAGTGSEVGRSAVITVGEVNRKVVIFSPHLIPSVAICDPELTIGLPPHLTAATGMDALSHNLEAVAAVGYHPMCEAIAVQGIALVAENLRLAVEDGRNRQARHNMMMASMMGAIAFQKGLGAAHSLAHPLSTELSMHHGLANAIVLPRVVQFNRSAARGAYIRAAHYFGIGRPKKTEPEGKGGDDVIDAFIASLEQLSADIGLPTSLSAAGVSRDALPALADKAYQDACHQLNPRKCTRDDLLGLYEAAFE
ncbi:MAG: iron-containing alcohol dehydrogenase [Phycisphaerae bacterium]|nr:iron-containing alcohol dehydrogenase [Phycisphaerae bacterium]